MKKVLWDKRRKKDNTRKVKPRESCDTRPAELLLACWEGCGDGVVTFETMFCDGRVPGVSTVCGPS